MKPTIKISGITMPVFFACLSLLILLLSGCATEETCKYISDKPVFFPPAPDEPHIQYLAGINSTDDISESKKKSGLSLIVTGKEKADEVKKLDKAFGIAVHKGKIYVAEGLNRHITIIDLVKGTFDEPEGLKTTSGAVLGYPLNLDLDDDDNLYVADTARRMIIVYDAQGKFKTSFGGGLDPKSKITDVKVYKGKVFALDMGNNVVRVLDRVTGEQLYELGKSENPEARLRLPGNFTIDGAGNIYITNIGSNKVVKLDQDGNFLGAFGGVGDQYGMFSKPKGIAVDAEKQIYVVDGGTNFVQVFNENFRLLTFFGWPGLPYGSLNGPSGIAVSTDNIEYFQKYAAPGFKVSALIYIVSQFGQEFCIPRISVYGLGTMVKQEKNR